MILLLSDNQARYHPIQQDLSREGFEVHVAHDFSRALLELDTNPNYQLILLDFDFSGHDVFDICQKLKRNSTMKFLPLVCILDKSRIVDQLMAFEMGADDFIYMPYSSVEIQLKIRSIQRISELQRKLRQKEDQLEKLKNIQQIMVTLNHYINNAITPLSFAVQMSDDAAAGDEQRVVEIARDTVAFISKVLQCLHEIVQSGKIRVLKEGVYKDMLIDMEQELKTLIQKSR